MHHIFEVNSKYLIININGRKVIDVYSVLSEILSSSFKMDYSAENYDPVISKNQNIFFGTEIEPLICNRVGKLQYVPLPSAVLFRMR